MKNRGVAEKYFIYENTSCESDIGTFAIINVTKAKG